MEKNGLKSYFAFLSNIIEIKEPKDYAEAARDPKWVQAMQIELKALEDNGTWQLSQLPSNKRAIASRWVFTIKYKANGEVERYKARLVAKGFN